ncbi:hypothetical protein [Lachnospira multipara]|uniref:Uncharacterized protein n=1 Tax=Lachnospira multipara TaxID=28051 RepID=A0A1H5VV47_9FIRM|nr:hypothetical protein [Lachnospira multipara]SEF90876.1 hypothetical protein SAMN05216537_112105 [Lachnospira multipara]
MFTIFKLVSVWLLMLIVLTDFLTQLEPENSIAEKIVLVFVCIVALIFTVATAISIIGVILTV